MEYAGKEAAVIETLVSPYINPTSQSAYPVWLYHPHSVHTLWVAKPHSLEPHLFVASTLPYLLYTC